MRSRRGPSPHGRVTLADVALRAGVSQQSVSNALHRPDRLSEETRARILGVVEELGYRPNRSARGLRSRRSHLIALRVSPAQKGRAAFLLDEFLHALSQSAAEAGNHVLLCEATDEQVELESYADLRATGSIDGIVLTDAHGGDARLKVIREWGVPFALFGRCWDGEERVAWVDVDGREGLGLATRHLVDVGHREIAHLGWPPDSDVGADRRAGWRAACLDAGLHPRTESYCDDDIDAAYEAASRLLDGRDAPTAITCASDTLALGVVRAAQARGLTIGRDLAVTGFDDSPTSALMTPGLTSLRQPLDQVARHLVAVLENQLTDEPGPPPQLLLAPELVVRESSLGATP